MKADLIPDDDIWMTLVLKPESDTEKGVLKYVFGNEEPIVGRLEEYMGDEEYQIFFRLTYKNKKGEK